MSIVNNDEQRNPGTGDQEGRITLKVIGQDGNESFFRMKRSTKLNKLMNAYCDRQSFDRNCYAFMYDGCRLQGYRTPDELEMEEGDEIDAFLRMYPGHYIDQRNAKTIVREEELIRKQEEAYGVLNETRAMLEMEEGDGINAYLHQTEEQRICFDELIAKDIAREEELIGKEEEVVWNKFRGIVWRFVSKLIAENSVLKDELKRLTRLRKDEEEDVVFMKIGRIVHKLMAKNSAPKEELNEKITRLKDELKEELTRIKEQLTSILEDDEEDDEGVYEEDDVGAYVDDDEEFIELGRFVSEVVEWGKKNKDVLGCQRSRL